jgi:hypothetical protein
VIKLVSLKSGRVRTVVGPSNRDVGSPHWSLSARRIVFTSQANGASG